MANHTHEGGLENTDAIVSMGSMQCTPNAAVHISCLHVSLQALPICKHYFCQKVSATKHDTGLILLKNYV